MTSLLSVRHKMTFFRCLLRRLRRLRRQRQYNSVRNQRGMNELNCKRTTRVSRAFFFTFLHCIANDEFQCQLSLLAFIIWSIVPGVANARLYVHNFCFFPFFFSSASQRQNCTEKKSVSNWFNKNNNDTESHIAPSTYMCRIGECVLARVLSFGHGIWNVAHPNDVCPACVRTQGALNALLNVINGKMNCNMHEVCIFSVLYVLTANRFNFTPH